MLLGGVGGMLSVRFWRLVVYFYLACLCLVSRCLSGRVHISGGGGSDRTSKKSFLVIPHSSTTGSTHKKKTCGLGIIILEQIALRKSDILLFCQDSVHPRTSDGVCTIDVCRSILRRYRTFPLHDQPTGTISRVRGFRNLRSQWISRWTYLAEKSLLGGGGMSLIVFCSVNPRKQPQRRPSRLEPETVEASRHVRGTPGEVGYN